MRERLETLFVFAWVVAPCLFGVFCAGALVGAAKTQRRLEKRAAAPRTEDGT